MSSPVVRVVWLITLCLALAACQWPTSAPGDITQPRVDDRDYRALQLENGLRVLLVSDPGADKAAAALDVDVGSRQDPDAYPGLAHFVEHMLFLGTERYPEAGQYQSFISAHGGNHNAYTAFQNTNYFFDVESAYLEPALDRFSDFFVAPLLQAEYVDRERNAVHSEFSMGLRDDQRRALDVLKVSVNPQHPFARFSVGNLDTLNDSDHPGSLRAAVAAFYERYYRAGRMALTVIGTQSLDELERMVRQRFTAVPGGVADPPEPVAEPLLPPRQAPPWVSMKSLRQERQLSLSWEVDDPRPHWRSKPLRYLGNILGHEGEGSLLSALKQRGWARGLSAGTALEYDGGALFRVNVELTETGQKHADEVVTLIYRTLARVRQQGIVEWLYREQATLARQQFDFREPGQPIRDASALASNLQRYPTRAVLWGPYAMEAFDAGLIADYLHQLRPERALVMLSAPDVQGTEKSPWYGVPYSQRPVTQASLDTWREAQPAAAITLPEPNPFVADKLPLKPLSQVTAVPVSMPHPGLELWFRQEDRFRVPRTNVYLAVHSPSAGASPRQSALTELYVRMVREELNEFSYAASLAGLNLELRHHLRGLTLELGGFSRKQPLLMERALAVLAAPELEPATFARVLREYRDELADRIQQRPYRLLFDELQSALYAKRWTAEELRAELAGVSAEEVAAHARELWQRRHLRLLVHGNAHADDARAMADRVAATLPPGKDVAVSTDIVRWPEGEWRHAVSAPHPDAALLLYVQAPDLALEGRAAFGVSMQMLESPFYRELRTEQQLGYVVLAGAYPQIKVPGAVFVAQSPQAGVSRLQAAISEFMAKWSEHDPQQLEPVFERHRESLAQQLGQAPQSLSEAGQRYWQDLNQGDVGFDSRERLRNAVRSLSFEVWHGHFRQQLLQRPRALWLYHGEDPAGRPVESWEAFRAGAERYRFE